MFDSIINAIPPIHREGYRFIVLAGAATVILGWLWAPLFWVGLVLTIWVALFFRDPERVTPDFPSLVISPADGRISRVVRLLPPPELELGNQPHLCISIFMNVFNCHVNRAPVGGRIERVAYKAGKFLNAELDKASDENERNGLVIRCDEGRVGVVQIAGLMARRIVCWAGEGSEIKAGERFGLIRFGSRVDVYLPGDIPPMVLEGQTAVAGETVLADFAHRGTGAST